MLIHCQLLPNLKNNHNNIVSIINFMNQFFQEEESWNIKCLNNINILNNSNNYNNLPLDNNNSLVPLDSYTKHNLNNNKSLFKNTLVQEVEYYQILNSNNREFKVLDLILC